MTPTTTNIVSRNRVPLVRFLPVSLTAVLLISTLTGCSERRESKNDAPRATADWRKIDADFAMPPAEFRLIQYSGHDGALVAVEKMVDAGIGGVNLFMQSKGYLQTEEAWKNMEANIAAIKKAGLLLWIGDDNGYPSGMAGGLVVAADPAFEARCLIEVFKDGTGTDKVRLDRPERAEKFVHAFIYPLIDGRPALDRGRSIEVRDDHVESEGLDGAWRLCAFAVQINNEGTQAMSTTTGFHHSGRYPDLLNPAAMEKFLALTHESYAKRFGPLQGKIDAFYTNEPNLMSEWFLLDQSQRPGGVVFLPWNSDLPHRFEKQHGYQLPPMLPALYGGDDAQSKLVRRHYYETIGTVLAENFSERISSWAEKNGTKAAGHPLLEEDMLHHALGYGDFFHFVERNQIVSCDIPMPDPGTLWNYWLPKFLSSAAQAGNREVVSALLDPLIGRPQGGAMEASPELFRNVVNMAVLCGVNQFNTYLSWDKYDPAIYRGMNEYVGRLTALMRGARSAATVAVYYPIETYQAGLVPSASTWTTKFWPKEWHQLSARNNEQDVMAHSLISHGIDFNWLHGDRIREARVEDGCLVAGGGRYGAIVMPQVELLPLDVAEKLKEFEAAGGKIVWMKSLPTLGDAPAEHEKVRSLFAGQKTVSPGEVAAEIGPVVPQGFELSSDKAPLIARFVRDGKRINYHVNNQAQPATVPLKSASGGPLAVKVYNPLDGSISPQQTPATVTIAPYSSLIVIEDPS